GNASISALRTTRRWASTLRHGVNRASNSGATASNASAAALRSVTGTSTSDRKAHRARGTVQVDALLEIVPSTPIMKPCFHLFVQDIPHAPVKFGVERALEQHREIAGVLRVALA